MATGTTANDLLVANEDESGFEIIDGERKELPPMSAYASVISSRIAFKINVFTDTNEIGEAVVETLFKLNLPSDRRRRPDVAFIDYNRWPKSKTPPFKGNAWNVVPNLAVEVVSPSDFADELCEKVDEYFRAGVESVWIVYPRQAIVHRLSSLTDIVGFERKDTLVDEKVLPGFKLPLHEIFLQENVDENESA